MSLVGGVFVSSTTLVFILPPFLVGDPAASTHLGSTLFLFTSSLHMHLKLINLHQASLGFSLNDYTGDVSLFPRDT